jgi:integrase/recombinase XerD
VPSSKVRVIRSKHGVKTAAANALVKILTPELKIQTATNGLQKEFSNNLKKLSTKNAITICDYVSAVQTEINLSNNYRRDCIRFPYMLTRCLGDKPFDSMNREDLLAYLNSLRKTDAQDSMHRWIGTYNTVLIHLTKFFKWLYYPNLEPKKRSKPKVVQNISKLRRKEQSTYKPSDMWSQEDDLLFLKYCPSKRDRCYHMIARDTSARPHEILSLKVGSVYWSKSADGRQYATVLVNGKTGSRSLLLTDSIPYLKDYLTHEHPQADNINAPLICGIRKANGEHISVGRLSLIYNNYKKKIFPKLLVKMQQRNDNDRKQMENLLRKPFNPYIRRHSSLTEKARILNESTLRVYSGWAKNSNMPSKYVHYFGDEANQDLLVAYGLKSKDKVIETKLKPKYCPNCNNPNQPNTKYCHSCGLVLSYDAYHQTMEDQHRKDQELEELKEQVADMQQAYDEVTALIRSPKKLMEMLHESE